MMNSNGVSDHPGQTGYGRCQFSRGLQVVLDACLLTDSDAVMNAAANQISISRQHDAV